tara:strand:+ start:13414 stop:13863 length:450 start_codon:yes stop_codon:yes gene_type:complete
MKANYFKKIGWILFLPSLIFGVLTLFMDIESSWLNFNMFAIWSEGFFEDDIFLSFIKNNITDEILMIGFIISIMFIAFSKEKKEDELLSKIRLESLMWAVYINYAIIIVCTITLYGLAFSWVMLLNLFTLLIIFMARYNWLLYKFRKGL